ncbi:MAG: hypothetical protein ABSF28_16365 [Terracidiphilus sp.]|jgi:hypothetical protein
MKLPGVASPRKRFAKHFLILSLLVLSTFLCPPAAAQSCAAISNGGIIPAQGQTLCIDPAGSANLPVMPPIELVQFDDNTCDTFNYTLSVDFYEQGSNYLFSGDETTAGYYESPDDLPGGTPWIVDWTENEESGVQGNGLPNFYEGGEAYALEYLNDDSLVSDVSFWIAGENPSLGTTGSVAQAASSFGAPWWLGHALTIESTSEQFIGGASSVATETYGYYGAPVYGYPDGFGIAQVDGKGNNLSDDDVWSWEQNLYDGIGIANSFQTPAVNYWNSQLALAQALATKNNVPISTYYPSTFTSTYCTFTPTGTGRNAYGTGFWITAYNTGTGNFDNNGFASVNPTTGTWAYNWTYASNVCSRASSTMPQ